MLPDFNRLKVFYYIYNEQSSTAAAKRLHITQSGVSQQLKKLEEETRTPLFTRVNKRLIPTTAGQNLYDIVKNFVTELEHGVDNLHESAEKPSGLLRIGAPPELGKSYFPGVFAAFHKKYPDVSLHLELADPTKLFFMVSTGELDFAYIDILPISFQPPKGISAYSIEAVVTEEFVLACSKNYYERNVGMLDLETLGKLEYIAYKSDLALFQSWFRLHFDTAPQALNVVFTVDSAQAIVTAIEEDLGLGIVVSHLLNRQIAAGTIVSLKGSEEKLRNTISCVKFRNKEFTITESSFHEHVRKELQNIFN